MIIMSHGWGFDAHFWDPIKKHFKQENISLDWGYWGNNFLPNLAKGATLIAHSFGLIKACQHYGVDHFQKIIALNSYQTLYQKNHPTICQKSLGVMAQDFLEAPQQRLKHFWLGCGLKRPYKKEPFDVKKLYDDLLAMQKSKILIEDNIEKVILAKNDLIIPWEVSFQDFDASKIVVLDDANHSTPFLNPEKILPHLTL